MRIVRIRALAKAVGQTEEDVRDRLGRYGWTTDLLGRAGRVTPNYLCKLIRSGGLVGRKIGRDWMVDKVAGDKWLEKKGVRVQ